MIRLEVVAIVPPSKQQSVQDLRPLALWVRGILLGQVIGLVVVFSIAFRINPYHEDGSAHTMATHQQLGLPPCDFASRVGLPCPACGMSTSFALLVRGDVLNSLGANWVGTLLATLCLAFIPWALVGIVRGRTLFIRSLEQALVVILTSLLALMLIRWGLVLGLIWANR